jgi:hypothetical protein
VRICYRHHAFFDHEGHVVRRFRCLAEESFVIQLADGPIIAVPAWMLDADACALLSEETRPRVSIAALVALRALVNTQFLLGTSGAATDGESRPQGDSHAAATPTASDPTEPVVLGLEPRRAVDEPEPKQQQICRDLLSQLRQQVVRPLENAEPSTARRTDRE